MFDDDDDDDDDGNSGGSSSSQQQQHPSESANTNLAREKSVKVNVQEKRFPLLFLFSVALLHWVCAAATRLEQWKSRALEMFVSSTQHMFPMHLRPSAVSHTPRRHFRFTSSKECCQTKVRVEQKSQENSHALHSSKREFRYCNCIHCAKIRRKIHLMPNKVVSETNVHFH